jgi:hypothetical protein
MEVVCENRAAGVVGVDANVSENKQKNCLSALHCHLTFVSLTMEPY